MIADRDASALLGQQSKSLLRSQREAAPRQSRRYQAEIRAGDCVNDDMSCRIDCRNDRRGLRFVAQQVSDNRVTGLVVCRGFDLRFASLCHWL
jgi:hypothetical protein